jgi:hypothetical protein
LNVIEKNGCESGKKFVHYGFGVNMMYDPRWDIVKFIDKAYGKSGIKFRNHIGWIYGSNRKFLFNYNFCGQRLDRMPLEEASNIVMTKLTYGA